MMMTIEKEQNITPDNDAKLRSMRLTDNEWNALAAIAKQKELSGGRTGAMQWLIAQKFNVGNHIRDLLDLSGGIVTHEESEDGAGIVISLEDRNWETIGMESLRKKIGDICFSIDYLREMIESPSCYCPDDLSIEEYVSMTRRSRREQRDELDALIPKAVDIAAPLFAKEARRMSAFLKREVRVLRAQEWAQDWPCGYEFKAKYDSDPLVFVPSIPEEPGDEYSIFPF